jgi:hypothetical protein
MNIIKKAIVLGFLVLNSNCLYTVDCTSELTKLLALKPFNSLGLYDYIQKIGAEVFSGVQQSDSRAMDKLLKANPTIIALTKETFEPWQQLGDCTLDYINNVWKQFINAGQKNLIDNKLKNGELTINLLNNVMISYSNSLQNAGNAKKLALYIKKLEDAITDTSVVFNYSLNRLPSPTWYPKTPSDLIEAFKSDTGVNFEPKSFLEAYKKIKNEALTKKLDKKLFENYVQAVIDDKYLNHFNSNILPKGISDYKTTCLKVTKFINFLEELIYQSKMYKSKHFWSSKPKSILTAEQQIMTQEIIDLLYSRYPGCETTSLIQRVTAANAERYKVPLLIFAQSRVLLIVLRAYMRKALLKNQE